MIESMISRPRVERAPAREMQEMHELSTYITAEPISRTEQIFEYYILNYYQNLTLIQRTIRLTL